MGSNESQFLLRINAISVMVAFFMRHKAQENYVSVRSLGCSRGGCILFLCSTQCSRVECNVLMLYILPLGCNSMCLVVHTLPKCYVLSVIAPWLDPWIYTRKPHSQESLLFLLFWFRLIITIRVNCKLN